MKLKQSIKLTTDEIQNIKYFFSLAVENYFGDKEELMKMASVEDDLLERFFDDVNRQNKE